MTVLEWGELPANIAQVLEVRSVGCAMALVSAMERIDVTIAAEGEGKIAAFVTDTAQVNVQPVMEKDSFWSSST